jgi:transcriptional regulator with PAS, ATPase and Fis domain
MDKFDYSKDLPIAVTVCDKDGKIIEMNEKAISTFKDDGGANLIGRNVIDCHPEPAKSKLLDMLNNANSNFYTIEKKGIKKLICQIPYFQDQKYQGFIEISIEIPFDLPHFVRG